MTRTCSKKEKKKTNDRSPYTFKTPPSEQLQGHRICGRVSTRGDCVDFFLSVLLLRSLGPVRFHGPYGCPLGFPVVRRGHCSLCAFRHPTGLGSRRVLTGGNLICCRTTEG